MQLPTVGQPGSGLICRTCIARKRTVKTEYAAISQVDTFIHQRAIPAVQYLEKYSDFEAESSYCMPQRVVVITGCSSGNV